MSEAKHTPAPWTIESFGIIAEAADSSFLKIASVHPVLNYVSVAERNANARLIATSPELLDFVKKQCAETNCICHFKSAGLTTLACTKCDAAALIARAEGRNA